jgi:DNA polymerase-3 subunit beta
VKLLIPKSNLAYALRRVQGAISGRAFNPWMACVLLKAEGARLLVSATNLDVQISHATDATVIEPGAALLPLASLLQFVTQFPEQEVEMIVDDKFHCTLVCGDSRGTLNGMDVKDFTPFPPQDRKGFEMAQSDLKAALRKTLIAVLTNDTRPVLCGILIELQDNRLKFMSADGKRASIVKQLLNGTGIRAILSAKGATEAMRLLGDDGEASVSIGSNTAEFKIGDTCLITKLIDAEYPNFNSLVPKSFAHRIMIDRDEFLGAVKYVGWIGDADKAPTTMFEFSRNKFSLHQASSTSEARRNLAVKFEGDVRIKVAPEYVAIILSTLTEDEVALEFTDDMTALSIKAGNFTSFVMPCRL